MDEDLRKLKQQQRDQWEETLAQLERSNLTINIGTGGGHVTDSDIDIHEIEMARRNINRLDAELATDISPERYVDQQGVLELQLVFSKRQAAIINRLEATEARVRKNERKLNPTLRISISTAASRVILLLLLFAFLFEEVRTYCVSEPLYSFVGVSLVLLLAFLFWWIPQAPNGNGRP